MYPFFGFGAIPKGKSKVSHFFALNGNELDPKICGVDAVIQSYRDILPTLKMSGPSLFAPLLQECKHLVEFCNDFKTYHILVIVTDGEIHDMEETIEEIADIAERNLPVSIIIVGVGDQDFSSMVKLDGDEVAIKKGISDIV
jgi:hypothetical protein